MSEPDPPVLTPVVIEPRRRELLPAIRDDLAPFMPAIRGAAQLLAMAAVAEFTARYAAPAIVDAARSLALPAQPKQVILIEEHTTTRRKITVAS